MNERDENLLLNIKDEAEILLKMTEGYDLQDFLTNEMMKCAVSMALINIGESVKKLSEELKQMNQTIPWSEIIGLRNIAAHGYQILQMEDIWGTATESVPVLLEQVKDILHAEEVEREK